MSSSTSSTFLSEFIESCQFIWCRCYGYGDAGYIYCESGVLACKDSIFVFCHAENSGTLGLELMDAHSNFFIQFCFFGSNVGTIVLTDVTINRGSDSFSGSPIRHSFSTKSPSRSVRTIVEWWQSAWPNWLPQGTLSNTSVNHLICYHPNIVEYLGF